MIKQCEEELRGQQSGPVVNILWHDLEETVQSNMVLPLPRAAEWQDNDDAVRSKFQKNLRYILDNRNEWRIIVHVSPEHYEAQLFNHEIGASSSMASVTLSSDEVALRHVVSHDERRM
jgi:AAA+ superfamily predicted ATPase